MTRHLLTASAAALLLGGAAMAQTDDPVVTDGASNNEELREFREGVQAQPNNEAVLQPELYSDDQTVVDSEDGEGVLLEGAEMDTAGEGGDEVLIPGADQSEDQAFEPSQELMNDDQAVNPLETGPGQDVIAETGDDAED